MNQVTSPAPLRSLSQVGAVEDFIDLRGVVRAIKRYRWGILGLALALTVLTTLFVFSQQPIYRASATLVLESQRANVVNVEKVYSVDTYNYNYTQTQYEILKSRNLAERTVRALELHEHSFFAPSDAQDEELSWLRRLLPASKREPPEQLTPQEQEERIIQSITDQIVSGLRVSPVEYSYVVHLSFELADPGLAAQIVNGVAQEFINSNLESRTSGTLQATSWLSERLEDLKLKLRDSEQALQEFREREGLVDVEGVTGLGGSELKTLSQRLQEATRSRIEAQILKEEVQGMINASTEQLMTIPAVLSHQLVRELKRDQSVAERKVAELAKRYGPQHPKMISARSDLEAANAELGSEVRKVVSGISHEYEVALRSEQQLKENWEARKSEMQNFNRIEFQLQELQRDVEANRQLYDIFFTRIKNISETGGFETPHARIVDPALTPKYPVKPNKSLSMTLALIFGLLVGCAVAVLLDALDNTVKSAEDVQQVLQAPLLGVVPREKSNVAGEFDQMWQRPAGSFAEAIRTVRTGIVLSSLDDPAKVIVVTSTIPGEGKSTVGLNLASALGQMEKVLLIGGDLRRPSLARKCGLAPNHRGLSHYVSNTADLEDCIEHLSEFGFDLMPAGVIPANPLEMISSRRFVEALDSLRQRYDRIVVDSAPLQAVSDALILASYADSVVYVVEADSTSATQVQKALGSLSGSNAPMTGIVLNKYDARRQRVGDYYYPYSSYHQGPEETPG